MVVTFSEVLFLFDVRMLLSFHENDELNLLTNNPSDYGCPYGICLYTVNSSISHDKLFLIAYQLVFLFSYDAFHFYLIRHNFHRY